MLIKQKPRVCIYATALIFKLLLSAKIIQTIIYVSAVSINRRYGYIFEKVSPVSQKETVREAFLLPPQLF